MNESAILTARKKKEFIDMDDIYDAIDRIQIGLEKKGGDFSADRQKLVSYHEAGHALLGADVGAGAWARVAAPPPPDDGHATPTSGCLGSYRGALVHTGGSSLSLTQSGRNPGVDED